jgi:hypothetical protein
VDTFLSQEWVGVALAAPATLLTVGSAVHLIQIARDASAFPPHGKLVDVGGYRMHLLAEGSRERERETLTG